MRYLILSPSGSPLEECDTLRWAENVIHRTNNCILYIPERDGELEDADAHNKAVGGAVDGR